MAKNKKTPWQRLISKTLGAMEHVMHKHGMKGFIPVGFSVIFYNKDASPEKRWYYDMRNIIDSHEVDFSNPKLQERINLVNEFLAEGCKRILEGEIEELMADKSSIVDGVYQVPGQKGKAG